MMSGRNATINSINEMEVGGDDDDIWGKNGGLAKQAETSDVDADKRNFVQR